MILVVQVFTGLIVETFFLGHVIFAEWIALLVSTTRDVVEKVLGVVYPAKPALLVSTDRAAEFLALDPVHPVRPVPWAITLGDVKLIQRGVVSGVAPQITGNTSHQDAPSHSVQPVPLGSTEKTVVTPAQECVCPVALQTLECTTLLAVHSHSAQTSQNSHLTQATEGQVTVALGYAIQGTPW